MEYLQGGKGMRVFEVILNGDSSGCSWDNIPDTLETIRNLLSEDSDKVTIAIQEMSKERFEALPEFQGW